MAGQEPRTEGEDTERELEGCKFAVQGNRN